MNNTARKILFDGLMTVSLLCVLTTITYGAGGTGGVSAGHRIIGKWYNSLGNGDTSVISSPRSVLTPTRLL
ncbi:MAG: hypothetical protein ACREVY_12550 [Gammaproteobacteria bacterium]